MLLSLFCGAGGLDLGFERAGFEVGAAFDNRSDSISSYNHNRTVTRGYCRDVTQLTPEMLDELWGGPFEPVGVVGGPPCQSFSMANRTFYEADPRHFLPLAYAKLLKQLNSRKPVNFFVLENVTGLASPQHRHRLRELKAALRDDGFAVSNATLNAVDFRTPQNRTRLFLVGLNVGLFNGLRWRRPRPTTRRGDDITVRGAIGGLEEPVRFLPNLDPGTFPHHRNHWCMRPKSKKFTTEGALVPGNGHHRSFKTLSWSSPSPTVAYGHREVHVHPDCRRRLSVFEALRLQGFPDTYELLGTLSSQITQVSEAVPPALAEAVATSLIDQMKSVVCQQRDLAA
ncbi:MAG: DNA cytosine methyltransferase [Terriglobales bacterium]